MEPTNNGRLAGKAVAAIAAAAILAVGCATEQVVWKKIPSTTFAELSLPEKATLRVVPSGGKDTEAFAARLRAALGSSGLTVVEDAGNATHLVLVQGGAAFRCDTPEEARFTGRVAVETVESDAGSFQRVKREQSATHSAAREISVAVYAVKTLAPVHYMTFPVFDGGVSEVGAMDARTAAMESSRIQSQFAKLAAARLEEVFATRQRPIGVPVPVEADGILKVKFAKIEAAVLADDNDAVRKALAEIDARAADPTVIPGRLEEFAEASAAKGWKPPEGTTREAILGNYYLVALRREIGCVDSGILASLHAEHLRILELCEGPSLRMACPIALSRLEDKLSRIGAK